MVATKNRILITENEYNELAETRKKAALERLKANFKAMQEQAIVNGTSEMTMDEIDDLIEEVRQKRG